MLLCTTCKHTDLKVFIVDSQTGDYVCCIKLDREDMLKNELMFISLQCLFVFVYVCMCNLENGQFMYVLQTH